MGITFRRAVRENLPLLIGLVGGTGSGKTYTALELATGMSGEDAFALIDTEAGRAKHYADEFTFDHAELQPPFSPAAYEEAILAADAAGYKVIVVDSMSHEWAGEGGVLDYQAAELQRMGGSPAVQPASWIKPKMAHKHMVQRLLQVRAHLILCFRAEDKIDIVKDESGRTKIVPKESAIGLHGWIPVTDKRFPYELTMSLMFTQDAPGVPKPIKIERQHLQYIDLNEPITRETGVGLVNWALGDKRTPDEILAALREVALTGERPLRAAWGALPAPMREELRQHLPSLKAAAAAAAA